MPEETPTPGAGAPRLGVVDYLISLAEHLRLLVLVPLLVAAIAYGLSVTKPGVYISTALVLLPQDAVETPAQAASVMRSEAVLARVSQTRKPPVDVGSLLAAVSTSVGKEGLIRLDVAATSPTKAEEIADAVLQAWLKTTVPGERDRVDLQARVDRARKDLANVQAAVDAVTKAMATGERTGTESMLRLAALSDTAERMFLVIQQVSRRMEGLTADVIKQPPTHPTVPLPSRSLATAIKAGLATFVVLVFALLLLRRVRELQRDPVVGVKLAQLSRALKRRKPETGGAA